jgi:hypothetical protein
VHARVVRIAPASEIHTRLVGVAQRSIQGASGREVLVGARVEDDAGHPDRSCLRLEPNHQLTTGAESAERLLDEQILDQRPTTGLAHLRRRRICVQREPDEADGSPVQPRDEIDEAAAGLIREPLAMDLGSTRGQPDDHRR